VQLWEEKKRREGGGVGGKLSKIFLQYKPINEKSNAFENENCFFDTQIFLKTQGNYVFVPNNS